LPARFPKSIARALSKVAVDGLDSSIRSHARHSNWPNRKTIAPPQAPHCRELSAMLPPIQQLPEISARLYSNREHIHVISPVTRQCGRGMPWGALGESLLKARTIATHCFVSACQIGLAVLRYPS
jgi:hypothetical protein